MPDAIIKSVQYYVPEQVLTNAQLANRYPEWPETRIEQKLGIAERHIVAEGECASDLGVKAAERLFATGACSASEIDFVLFCTQSPDYFLPSTSCLLQARLGIPDHAGALDYNLGCSGFVYGLSLAKGLIETGQARKLLLITADTYSKFLHPEDKSVRTLFGDGAAATLVQQGAGACPGGHRGIGPFVLGTDGRGARNLIVEAGGMRRRVSSGEMVQDENGNPKCDRCLYMNGGEILTFTLDKVPWMVSTLLKNACMEIKDVDLFVFHQANQYILEILRKACGIPKGKFFLCLRKFGNTVSSSIPIALHHAEMEGALRPGQTAMLVGFGVGYSWGATLVRWQGEGGVRYDGGVSAA